MGYTEANQLVTIDKLTNFSMGVTLLFYNNAKPLAISIYYRFLRKCDF